MVVQASTQNATVGGLKVILGCKVRSGPVWVTGDPVSKQTNVW